MAGRTVDLQFRADLSNLVSQLKQLPGTTTAEAKKMASSLERQIKKAEKASIKAAKASAAAYRRQKTAMDDMGDAAAKSAAKLKNLEETGGETSSIMGGVAGALDLVSPSAGSAARALGDMSGGIEMVARAGMGLAGPLAALSAGAAIGAKIWSTYAEKQKKVQAELEETRRKKLELSAAMNDLDQDLLEKKLERMRTEGLITRAEHEEWKTRNRTELKFGKQLDEAQQKASTARAQLIRRKEREARLEAAASPLIRGTVEALEEHRKAVAKQAEVEAQAAAEYVNLRGKIESKNSAMVEEQNKILAVNAAEKIRSGSAKERETELERLTKLTQNLLPKEDLSKFEELNRHLKILEAAAGASAQAAAELEGPISATAQAIEKLQAQKAAEELDELIAAYDRLAPAPTLSRMAQLEAAQRQINDAIAAGSDSTGALQAKLDDINAAIREESKKTKDQLQADQDAAAKAAADAAQRQQDAYLSAFSNISGAASAVAEQMLQNTTDAAQEEVDQLSDKVDDRQAMLEEERQNRADLLDQAAERDVSRELAASEAKIAMLTKASEAERAALFNTRAAQGEAVRDAFMLTKALKLSEIAMGTASAIVSALTVPPPAGLVLAGTVAAMGATQAGIVAAQEPPSFHLGGIVGSRPDERQITARAGEGVLTRQGVQAIGGEQAVAAANRGQGGGQALIVQHVYKHKVLDEVLSDSVRRGGPIGGAINRRSPRGRTNPHGRR